MSKKFKDKFDKGEGAGKDVDAMREGKGKRKKGRKKRGRA